MITKDSTSIHEDQFRHIIKADHEVYSASFLQINWLQDCSISKAKSSYKQSKSLLICISTAICLYQITL